MPVITSPISGTTIEALTVGDVMNLLYTDLNSFMDTLSGADISFHYPEMERSYGEWGALLREGRIPAASGQTVNKNATAMCPTAYFDAESRYYQEWTEKVYRSEVRRIDITKILRGEADYGEFISRIIQRNVEGWKDETNQGIDHAFLSTNTGISDSLIVFDPPALNITGDAGWLQSGSNDGAGKERMDIMGYPRGSVSYADVWAQVLYRVFDMEKTNNTYTLGTNRYGGNMRDLTIYIPTKFAAFSDVKYLQTLKNFRGMDQLPTIRTHGVSEISDADNTAYYNFIYILDNRVLNHVTRYMSYDEDRNNCRKSNIFDLHVEDMIKYVPFYKAWAVVVRETVGQGA